MNKPLKEELESILSQTNSLLESLETARSNGEECRDSIPKDLQEVTLYTDTYTAVRKIRQVLDVLQHVTWEIYYTLNIG